MKRFSERTADLLFDFSRFVIATVIVGRVFVSLDNVKVSNGDFVLAVALALAALALGYIFDYQSLKGR